MPAKARRRWQGAACEGRPPERVSSGDRRAKQGAGQGVGSSRAVAARQVLHEGSRRKRSGQGRQQGQARAGTSTDTAAAATVLVGTGFAITDIAAGVLVRSFGHADGVLCMLRRRLAVTVRVPMRHGSGLRARQARSHRSPTGHRNRDAKRQHQQEAEHAHGGQSVANASGGQAPRPW